MDRPDVDTIEVLSRDECLNLLQYKAFVGRVGFVTEGRPFVMPVNYLCEDDSVVFCTAEGTQLGGVGDGAPVAFEVDDSSAMEHSGWSVLVHGTAREVTDPQELEALRRGPLRSWARRPAEHWVRIPIDEISGRRLRGL
jgi:nitroimidazol reductase NimA-like FMN-containing flavoprotein (pyridoxamine 5'-phosphate oxidase superfamily)